MKSTTESMEDVCVAELEPEETNAGCQVRRKIEDILERRRNQDELGDARFETR